MKRTTIDRHYIFKRDKGACHFCGRSLRFGRMSLDHYYPRSAGGPDEVFNLVCACKDCNNQKRSVVPEDWQQLWIEAFITAVRDRKLFSAVAGITGGDLERLTVDTRTVRLEGEKTIFDSKSKRFHVKQGRIIKITEINILDE